MSEKDFDSDAGGDFDDEVGSQDADEQVVSKSIQKELMSGN